MNDKELEVKKCLINNPDLSSEAIAIECQITKNELIEIYKTLKGEIPKAKERAFGKSYFFHQVLDVDILPDLPRIEKIMNKEFVFPDTLELHLGLTCQCACVFCWRWIEKRRQEGEFGLYNNPKELNPLTLNYLEKLLTEFKQNGGKILYLSGGLEFFTSNLAKDALRIASNLHLKTRVYTNGVGDFFEKNENIDLILNNSEYIRFSVNAFTNDTYNKVAMPHKSKEITAKEFRQVINNIINLIDRRKDLNLEKSCKIYIAFVAIGENYQELLNSVEFWNDAGVDSFDIRVDMIGKEVWFTSNQFNDFKKTMEELRHKKENKFYQKMQISGERQEKRDKLKYAQKCYIPFKKPAIDPFGRLYACCYGAHPSLQHHSYYLGKYPEESLYNILKRLHDDKILPKPHCGQCTDWEMTYNLCVEKIINDWKAGFHPELLPL